MLLSARILTDVSGVNSFSYANQAEWTAGDTVTLYLQLVDLTKDKALEGFVPGGRRFVPVSGATLRVTLTNIDDAKAITRSASQAYASLDGSIWAVSILASDTIQGTCDLVLALTQGGVVTTGRAPAAVAIHPAGTP